MIQSVETWGWNGRGRSTGNRVVLFEGAIRKRGPKSEDAVFVNEEVRGNRTRRKKRAKVGR